MPLTLYARALQVDGLAARRCAGRDATMPVRIAEAEAVRRIIENRFGKDFAADKRWVICGDFNDYRQSIAIAGDARRRLSASRRSTRPVSCLDVLLADGFAVNIVERRPELDRWTLYHTRGPQERHLCQLDYILLSPALAGAERARLLPDIIRRGQPWRTIFPPGPGGRALSARRLGPAEGVGPLPGRRHARHRLKPAMSFDIPRGVILPVDARRRSARSRHRIRSRPTTARAIDGQLAAREVRPIRRCSTARWSLLSGLAYRERRLGRPLPHGPLRDLSLLAQATRRMAGRRARLCPCHAGDRATAR